MDQEVEKDKVVAFIDGFNLYHSLKESNCGNFKWLNYWSLAEAFISQSKEKLVKVIYFTAFPHWDNGKVERHKTFIRALETKGVEVVYGKFKQVTRKCRAECKKIYTTFEEKETDINIAVRMLLEASKEPFDKALLFSGDSDMIAGVKALKEFAPNIHIKVVIPYHRSSIDLVNACHSFSRIKKLHLENNQLPDSIELGEGTGKFLVKPSTWV